MMFCIKNQKKNTISSMNNFLKKKILHVVFQMHRIRHTELQCMKFMQTKNSTKLVARETKH